MRERLHSARREDERSSMSPKQSEPFAVAHCYKVDGPKNISLEWAGRGGVHTTRKYLKIIATLQISRSS